MTRPTLHSNFDPNLTSRVEAVPGGSFGVCFWVPKSGWYIIAKVSDFDSDCRFGIFDLLTNMGVGGRKKSQEADLKPLGPPNGCRRWPILGDFDDSVK